MSSKNIGKKLRELREKAGLTPKEVYERLGIKQARFSAWETGKAEPSADNLLTLCKMYGVEDVFEAFGYDDLDDNQEIVLDHQEMHLIDIYRRMSKEDKELVLNLFASLDEKSEFLDDDTVSIPYCDFEDLEKATLDYSDFNAFKDNEVFNLKEMLVSDIPLGTDFIVKISDNSMEPFLSKGDLACFKDFTGLGFNMFEKEMEIPGIESDKIYLFSICDVDEFNPYFFAIRYPFYRDEHPKTLKPANTNWDPDIIPYDTEIAVYGELLGKVTEDSYSNKNSSISYLTQPIFTLAASAGAGNFLDSDDYELVQFPEEAVPRESMFGVRVSGDSMEPDYPDGSIVFVKRTKHLDFGDVGIFILNGEGYLKKLGKDHNLVSINPKYKDIIIQPYDDCRIVGKVVGSYVEKEA